MGAGTHPSDPGDLKLKNLSLILAVLLGAMLACVAVAGAKPKPAPTAAQAAERECATLEQADEGAFAAIYGRGSSRACVRDEQPGAADAVRDVAEQCRDERGHSDRPHEAFKRSHRSGKGANDAFSRCVSAGIREDRRHRRDEFTNAADECRAERGETPGSWAAFAEKYGIDKSDPLWIYKPGGNAFGECVSARVGHRD